MVRRWKRLTRWEFWSPYFFYSPVIAYVAYLGIRFRSWTLFTAANPAIPAGGFVGESKHQIFARLKNATAWLPDFIFLASGEPAQRRPQAEEFMRTHGVQFPVVLKPDAGQRGSGVSIVRSSAQLRQYLTQASFPAILQEYVPGEEYGVFYYRYPGNARGRVLSVTEKRMPVLLGDGRRTLEELVLADDRAVCMSDFYLRKNSERAQKVPGAGEQVQLVEIGAHCRGAIFLDGGDKLTPALEESIDRIAQRFDGFFFGRFDIRVPSREDFAAGRNVKIVELNGVTSEATHIYDPKLSLFDAYRVLFRQWRIAFEIGDLNCVRGTRPAPQLVLPEPPYGEAHPPQCPPARQVTPAVAHQLREPVLHVGLRHMAVLGAAVVEAPVGEDGEAQAGDDHVGLPRKRSDVHVYAPPAAQCLPHGGAEPRLRGRARAPDAGHDFAALLGRENVSHLASTIPCGSASSYCWHGPSGNQP